MSEQRTWDGGGGLVVENCRMKWQSWLPEDGDGLCLQVCRGDPVGVRGRLLRVPQDPLPEVG